ncbi:hypothetical protein, partial [Okeania sp. SIO3I5]|uniref:hypothetical protein n=1 Tax=Okeania sp. SIO3I5 TaxID=2607805 RepID=UPI0025CD65DB
SIPSAKTLTSFHRIKLRRSKLPTKSRVIVAVAEPEENPLKFVVLPSAISSRKKSLKFSVRSEVGTI